MPDWRGLRARRRRQIVDAACRCFAAKGVHRTRISDVQQESGLSAGAVYAYFPNKDELIRAAAAQVMASVADAAAGALRAAGPGTPREAVERAVAAVRGAEPRLALVVDFWTAVRGDAGAAEGVRASFARIHGECVGAARRMSAADPEQTGTEMFHLLQGALVAALYPLDRAAAPGGA
jgi:AcrR family transcriptional regulator